MLAGAQVGFLPALANLSTRVECPLEDIMRIRFLPLTLLVGLLIVIAGCESQENTPPLIPEGAGFVFHVDPSGKVVTRIETSGSSLEPEFLPSNTRILEPDIDLELSYFDYKFLAGNRFEIYSKFTNIHEQADYHQPFFFTLNTLDNAVSANAPLVTDENLGDDGVLESGEETSLLTFEVVHQGVPFDFLVDANAVTLTLTDLGTLGGNESWARDLNEQGQVVGSSTTASGNTHAFLWEDGVMIDLGTLDAPYNFTSLASSINERGQIAGTSYSSNLGLDGHAFLWEDGVMIDLGTLGGAYSQANAINGRGQVVGFSETPSGEQHAFLWENGVMTDIGPAGLQSYARFVNEVGEVAGLLETPAPYAFFWKDGVLTQIDVYASFPRGFNNRGQVVGEGCTSPSCSEIESFLWEDGQLTIIGGLPGSLFSQPDDVNELGQVVGQSHVGLPLFNNHAYLWEDGVITDLGTLAGPNLEITSSAIAINNLGQVVGNSETTSGENHAFLWEDGVMTDLGPVAAGEINDSGQILGSIELPSGDRHAVLLTIGE